MNLEGLLEQCDDAYYLYDNGNSNHLPMALRALNHINGSFEQIETLYNIRKKKMLPNKSPNESIHSGNWKDYLGRGNNFGSYQHFFGQQVVDMGWKNVLKQYLDPLMSGVSSGAFHSLIRLAYGVEDEAVNEIINGLAIFADSYLLLGHSSENTPLTSDIFELVNIFRNSEEIKPVTGSGMISARMKEGA